MFDHCLNKRHEVLPAKTILNTLFSASKISQKLENSYFLKIPARFLFHSLLTSKSAYFIRIISLLSGVPPFRGSLVVCVSLSLGDTVEGKAWRLSDLVGGVREKIYR